MRAVIRAGIALVLLFLLMELFHPTCSTAQDPDFINREYKIKAAYLYNFAKYVEWPAEFAPVAEKNEPVFVIGVVGKDPFGKVLLEVAQEKKVGDKRIVIRNVGRKEDIGGCHIVYFPADTPAELARPILAQAKSMPTLTVGEQDGFLESGGILNFYMEQNNIRFAIDPDAAARSRLKISSKLLNIARTTQAK